MSDIQVTSVNGNQINVTTGVVVGPLPSLQLAAGTGITIASGGGVSTISADLTSLSVPTNLADLSNVNGTPTTGQVLAWDGSAWAPADDQTGGSSNVANLADLTDVSNATPANGQALIWSGSEWAGGNIPPGTTVNGLSGAVNLVPGEGVTVSSEGQNVSISANVSLDANDIEYAISSPGFSLDVVRDDEARATALDVNWPSIPFGVVAVSGVDGDATVMWQEPIPRASEYVIQYEKVGALPAPQITSASIGGGDLSIDVDYQDTQLDQDVQAQYSTDGGSSWQDV